MILKIRAKVVARARENKIIKEKDGSWKIKVTTAPTGGKANDKIIELIALEIDTAKTNVTIVKGLRSKEKTIEIFL